MAPERLLFKGFTEDLKSSYELLVRLGKADLQIKASKGLRGKPGRETSTAGCRNLHRVERFARLGAIRSFK